MDNLVEQFTATAATLSAMDLHHANRNAKSHPSYAPHQHLPTKQTGLRHLDPETDFKVRRIVANVNEASHIAVNEPTTGLYRIQEHVHRTLPQLVQRKRELKENLERINDTVYDLNLSIDVIDSVSHIPHFTRIQEALKTAIETKRKLNIKEDQEHARLQLNSKQAARANRSISQNEPAEGYICPVCMLALSNQDALILHWQENHNIEKFENDTIQQEDGNALGESNDARSPNTLEAVSDSNYTIKSDNDLAVIDIPQQKVHRAYSDCEDVVKSFVDDEDMLNATAENADVSSKENYSIGKETEERIAPSS